jgi:hypothetical protein
MKKSAIFPNSNQNPAILTLFQSLSSPTNKLVQVLTCIMEVLSSNLRWDSENDESRFSWFSSLPSICQFIDH